MTTATLESGVKTSYLDMSDEELMKLDPSAIASEEVVEEKEEVEVDETPATETVDPVESGVPAVETTPAETTEATQDDEEDSTEQVEQEVEKAEKKPVESNEPDYKAEYSKIFAPFKANGKEIAISSAEDAISLMQMGANYNKKMAALKPNLKLMKLLENNGLLSEEKISYLIDLEKKDPTAISKLVKDSGLDHMDLDADKASEYKPKTYTVDDREMELDAVLDEIQGTPAYNRTLDIVSTKWDGPSKQVIASSPQLLKVINNHIQSGIYDIISKEIESERMFGRLNGLSDIEAYRQVGDAIQARGGFNSLGNQEKPAAKTVVVPPKPKQVDEDKLREKRRAASSTKPIGSTQSNQDYNPLALSDDAFGKLVKNEYL